MTEEIKDVEKTISHGQNHNSIENNPPNFHGKQNLTNFLTEPSLSSTFSPLSSTQTVASESSTQTITSKRAHPLLPSRLPILDEYFEKEQRQLYAAIQEKTIQWTKQLEQRQEDKLAKTEQQKAEAFKTNSIRGSFNGKTALQKWLEMEQARIAEYDQNEVQIIESKREEAQTRWSQLKNAHESRLVQIHTQQSQKLAENDAIIIKALARNDGIFDLTLFEEVVEKCGKGRSSVYGMHKMARFWQVLDKIYKVDDAGKSIANDIDGKNGVNSNTKVDFKGSTNEDSAREILSNLKSLAL